LLAQVFTVVAIRLAACSVVAAAASTGKWLDFALASSL